MQVNVYYNDNTCLNDNNILNSTLYSVSPENCSKSSSVLFQLTCSNSKVTVTRCDANFTALQIPSPLVGCTPLGTLPNFKNIGKKDSYYFNQPCEGNEFKAGLDGKTNNVTASAFSPAAVFGVCVGVLVCLFMFGVIYYYYRKQYRKKEKVVMENAEEETELDDIPVVVVAKKVVDDDEESLSLSDDDENSLNRDQTLYKRSEGHRKGKHVEDDGFTENRTLKSFSIKRNGTLLNRFDGDSDYYGTDDYLDYPQAGPSENSENFQTLAQIVQDSEADLGPSSRFQSFDRPSMTRTNSQMNFTTVPLKQSPSIKRVEASFRNESSPLSEGGASLRKTKSTASKVSFAKQDDDEKTEDS